jgi:hypothetical protein
MRVSSTAAADAASVPIQALSLPQDLTAFVPNFVNRSGTGFDLNG